MNARDFVRRYGGIYESSPWVAELAAPHIDESATVDEIARIMADCVDNASRDRQLELIRAHPDLAGRADWRWAERMLAAGELTPESTEEQASAGLDQCTPQQFERFTELNEQYTVKFAFPFVMAVRGSSRDEILAAFERRLGHDYDQEFETALDEIHKIARLRLEAMT